MRNMSFMLTLQQIRDRTKDVTRRNGWDFLQPGDLIRAVHKSQGLKKGEHPIQLAVLRVETCWREPLDFISQAEVVREGFPDMTCEEFIAMFIKSHKGVTRHTRVRRIQFSYVDY